jgi:hypothetical protein
VLLIPGVHIMEGLSCVGDSTGFESAKFRLIPL